MRSIVGAFFHRLGEGNDVDGWLDLLADEITVDTPLAPKGEPTRFEGKPAVESRFAGARRRMPVLTFYDLDILATEDHERWVATCRSEGVRTNGQAYQNRYCWILRIRDGKVVWWAEYFDPQEVLASR
jgi:uncharacterized protein